ncbi:putative sporulation protein YtxC [Lutibacter sp. B2]|nr:putative sporulation protein YtxC [Lutibacter sp. B2]
MVILTVLLNEYSKEIYDRLKEEVLSLKKEGIIVNQEIEKQKDMTVIYYSIDEMYLQEDYLNYAKNKLKCSITNAISNVIIYNLEKNIVIKILQSQYDYFNGKERELILKHYQNIKNQEQDNAACIEGKTQIFYSIMSYFKDYDSINVEGFIRFRLKNYLQKVEYTIDKAVEDFLMEKEYNEFIHLLRYFVDIQEPKIDVVNVLVNEDGKYYLYDDVNCLINNEYIEELASEMIDKDIGHEDLLISSLITLAPKKINIHFAVNTCEKEIIETIKRVFVGRVELCSGCKLCSKIKNASQE